MSRVKGSAFTGAKVFCATLPEERARLGERIADWISASGVEVVDKVVVQSSDDSYHCLSVILFFVDGTGG